MKTLKEALFSRKNIKTLDFLDDERSYLIQTDVKNSLYNIYTIIAKEELTRLKNQFIVKLKCGINKSFNLHIDEAEEWLSGKTKIFDIFSVVHYQYRNDTFYPDNVYLLEKYNFGLVFYDDFVLRSYADIERATTILEKI